MSVSEESESLLRRIAPILAVLGVGLYAYITYVYQRFYSALDVTPGDVGVTYATTLSRSVGLIVAGLVTFLGLVWIGKLLGALLLSVVLNDVVGLIAAVVLAALIWLALPYVLYPVTVPPREADIAANLVRVGLPVAPVRLYGFTVMDLRADAATVAVNGNPDDSPAVKELASRRDLLYLGRAEGAVVLFDPATDEPIQVPANAVVLRLQRPPARNSQWPECALAPTIREWWEEPLIGPLRSWRPRC
jgi:hypothetical protein